MEQTISSSKSRTDAVTLPQKRPSFAYTIERAVAHLSRYTKPKVLDIGCGRKSDIGHYLKSHDHNAIIHGADLDEYALKNNDVDQLFICDAADMPFNDGTYDFVFSQFLLEHVEDSQKTVGSIARVLAKDGLAVLIIPNPSSIEATVTRLTPYSFHLFFKKKIQQFDNVGEDTFPTLFDFKSVSNLKKEMEAAGFTEVEAVYIPEAYFRFRFRPIMVRLALTYARLITALKLNTLKDSVVMVGRKA